MNNVPTDITIPRSFDGPSPDDWLIAQPLDKLHAVYCRRASRSTEYTRYSSQRMLQDFGWGNRLSAADLYVSLMVDSQLEHAEAEALLERRDEIDEALSGVPMDAALERIILEGSIATNLHSLFRVCKVEGVDFAKTSKWLHLKRPGLIPMLEDSVLKALQLEPARPEMDPAAFADRMFEAVLRFQRLVHWPEGAETDNRQAVMAITETFNDTLSKYLDVIRVPVPHPKLTPVRILETLVWFDQGGYRDYGFQHDQVGRRIHTP